MQFLVPKYLERESTIAFGLTFKKLGVLGGMSFILFILYYVLKNKLIFGALVVLFAGIFAAFNFIKIRDQSLLETISHFFKFIFSTRLYFWQKKERMHPIKVIKKKKEDDPKKAPLRIAPRSRLHDIGSKIDLGQEEEPTEAI